MLTAVSVSAAFEWLTAASAAGSKLPQWPAYAFGAVALAGLYCTFSSLLGRWPFGRLAGLAPTPAPIAQDPASPPPSVTTETRALANPGQPLFDEAPPELAHISLTSLKDSFAGRTQAQGDKLMEQHVGKPVRISGEVERVALGSHAGIPSVTLKATSALLLFFDPEDDYDPVPIVLALNVGDKIVVSGRVDRLAPEMVSLDHCRLIEARGRVA